MKQYRELGCVPEIKWQVTPILRVAVDRIGEIRAKNPSIFDFSPEIRL